MTCKGGTKILTRGNYRAVKKIDPVRTAKSMLIIFFSKIKGAN